MVPGDGWTERDPVSRKEATWSRDARLGEFLCGSYEHQEARQYAGGGGQQKDAKLSFLELVLKTVSQSGSINVWRVCSEQHLGLKC